MKKFERPPGCTCRIGTEDNPIIGGYARCPIHDPNIKNYYDQDIINKVEKVEVKTITEDKVQILINALEDIAFANSKNSKLSYQMGFIDWIDTAKKIAKTALKQYRK